MNRATSPDEVVAAANADRFRLLTSASSALHVVEGHVDLFWVEVENGAPCGARRHVARIDAGGIVFAVPLIAHRPERSCGLVMAAGRGADLVAVTGDEVWGRRQASAAGVEMWVSRLVRAAGMVAAPGRPRVPHAGERLELAAQELVRAAPRTLTWLRVLDGQVTSTWTSAPGQSLSPARLLPMTQELAARAEDASVVAALTTEAALASGAEEIATAIDAFNRQVLAELAARFAAEDAATIGRREERRRVSEIEMSADLTRLAHVAAPRAMPHHVLVGSDPIVAVLRLITAEHGIAFEPPLGAATPASSPFERVVQIAAAANLRCRRVVLRDRWWLGDSGAMLAFKGEARDPVALVPTSGRYRLIDPATGTDHSVDAALSDEIAREAFTFYRPLAETALGLRDLVAFCRRDIAWDWLRLLLVSLAIGLLGIAVPLATAIIFDTVVPNAERTQLITLVAGIACAAVGSAMFEAVRAFAIIRMQGRLALTLQPALLDRLIRLPAWLFKNYTSGDLADRLLGIDAVRRVLSTTAVTLFVGFVVALFNFVVLFVLSVKLALVAAGLVAISLALSTALCAAQLHHERRRIEREGRIRGLLTQFVIGVNKLRVAAREGRATGQWAREATEEKTHAVRARRYEALQQVAADVFPVLATAAAFLAAVELLPRVASPLSDFSLGDFLAFNAAFGQLLAALTAISFAVTKSIAVMPFYERARPILETPPEAGSASTMQIHGEIEFQRVTFRYRAHEPTVLDDVSLAVAPGEFVAIVGRSGSGKSTLMRLLLGFETAESGTVLFDGRPTETLDMAAVRRQIGVVLQDAKLSPGSIYENIVGHTGLGLREAWDAARLAGLDAEIEAMPMGMHTVLMEDARSISGGQRQRLMIARALVHRPRIVVLDEATSALDNRNQAHVMASLAELNVTRLVIAHRLSTIRAADRIVVLERGRLVQSGTYDELMALAGPFAALARRQLVD
jgi:NHLM bacteriocin system ABC transporter ATP-binding protein